jgi:2-isopropylmalate synthase
MSIIIYRSPEFSQRFHKNFHALTPWIPQGQKPEFIINDLTLRDGKQALPWWTLWVRKQAGKLVHQMADVGVHHVEVGFPAIPGDPETETVAHLANALKDRDMALFGLARLMRSDIETAMEALAPAKYKGIHTFIGTSDIHIDSRRHTLGGHEKMSASEYRRNLLRDTREMVRMIVEAGYMSQFSPEDATRTDPAFLMDVLSAAVESGAQILNIPDTLGYADTEDYTELLAKVHKAFPDQIKSTHTHNDWSQAEMNALIPLKRGVAQRLEGTIFGIGERAGNADWTSIVLGLMSHPNPRYQEMSKNLLLHPEKIGDVTSYFTHISGIYQRPVGPGHGYEAITNRSGVHQAEVAKLKKTYIWMQPHQFGYEGRPMFDITPLSGKHGVREVLLSLGIDLGGTSKPGDIGDTIRFDDDEQLDEMTKLYRMLFTPDFDSKELHEAFPTISMKDMKALRGRCQKIREESRRMKNNESGTKDWLKQTDNIILEAFNLRYPDYRFGPYKLEEFKCYGEEGKLWKTSVQINGKRVEVEAPGAIDSAVKALRKAAIEEACEFLPEPFKIVDFKQEDASAEVVAEMKDKHGNKVTVRVRNGSLVDAYKQAYMRGINMLATIREHRRKKDQEERLEKTA